VPSNNGYSLEAFTDPGLTSLWMSSVTLSGTLGTLALIGLNPDTTYYLRVGSLWNGTTNYAPTVPASTSTLTNFISPTTLGVTSTTVSAGWIAFDVGSGTNTTQGYRFEAYTDANYTALAGSSQTVTATASTLTISGLAPFTTYYLRAGAIN